MYKLKDIELGKRPKRRHKVLELVNNNEGKMGKGIKVIIEKLYG